MMSSSTYTQALKKDLEIKYSAEWLTYIKKDNVPNKLLNYSKFKTGFNMENYVLSQNLENRRNFTKLRVSAHNLAIETGRYTRPKTPVINRTCILCDNTNIEDEYHLVMECPIYSEERQSFIDAMSNFSNFTFNTTERTFVSLMNYNNGDHEFATSICKFVNICFTKRNDIFIVNPAGLTRNFSASCLINQEFLRLSNILW